MSTPRHIDQIKNADQTVAYLDARGWAYSVPDDEERQLWPHWKPTVWPPVRKDGQPTKRAMEMHRELCRRGLLGPLKRDELGGLCAEVQS